VHRNVDAERAWFTSAYFHRPEEIAGEAAARRRRGPDLLGASSHILTVARAGGIAGGA
jgi:hypothetical protein